MSLSQRFKRAFIGDRAFYAMVVRLVIPIIIQLFVTNFVNMLDNIMVGQLGTDEISGVAIANQLVMVFNLCIFGGVSGPGIFGAQFFGSGDMEGVRNTFRIKLWISFSIVISAFVAILGFGPSLISQFLQGDGDPASAQRMLGFAIDYIHIIMIGFIPFIFTIAYSGTLRESGETVLPMKAGITAVLVNLVGNYVLIYGHLGFPRMGVQGAAIATVASRFVELAIILYAVHVRGGGRFEFLRGVYRTLKVPFRLLKSVLRKGAPLLVNEFLWSVGMATLVQTYSLRGLNVLGAMNIATTINNLFNMFFLAMGNAIAIVIGQHLGANRMTEAKRDVWRLIGFSVAICAVVGSLMAAFSSLFPMLYTNVGQDVRDLATRFILTMAVFMPMYATSHACYFTLRSGGSTLMTFIFDAAYVWVINIPLARVLIHYTALPIELLYPLCELAGIIKLVLGISIVKSGIWVKNIVDKQHQSPGTVPEP